jgi:fumarate hydratase class II
MDSLGEVDVPADTLRGAQTQRWLDRNTGKDLISRENDSSLEQGE